MKIKQSLESLSISVLYFVSENLPSNWPASMSVCDHATHFRHEIIADIGMYVTLNLQKVECTHLAFPNLTPFTALFEERLSN